MPLRTGLSPINGDRSTGKKLSQEDQQDGIWIFNLGTTDLNLGTYEIGIKTPEGLLLRAGFVLR
jgi:hypothetical protein